MNKVFYLLLAIIILISCSSTKSARKKPCEYDIERGFSEVVYDKFNFVINGNSTTVNEVRYYCMHDPYYTKKVMYDKFGKWSKLVYNAKEKHPILIWENIRLFPEDTTRFTVATTGKNPIGAIYSSVLVLDKNNNDLISENSPYRDKLAEYFGKLITQNHSTHPYNSSFYKIYFKEFDREHWNTLQRQQTLPQKTNQIKKY